MVAHVTEIQSLTEDYARRKDMIFEAKNPHKECSRKLRFSSMAQEHESGEYTSKKKKKKFKPANHLLLCFSILDSRYDGTNDGKDSGQDGREFISLKHRRVSNIHWDEDCELAADIFSHGRSKQACSKSTPKSRKQLKEIQFNSKLVKLTKTGNKSIKVKSDIYSRKIERDDAIKSHIDARKANIEQELERRDLKRRGVTIVQFAKPTPPSNNRTGRKKPRWSRERIEERTFKWEVYPFALVEEVLEVEHSDKSDPEAQFLWTLIQLQNRDLTPEDYDLLLRLDEKVEAKTVDMEKLKTLKTQVLSGTDLSSSTVFEDPCMVCMENYQMEQTVKSLPCNHVFHDHCIDNWLTNSGNRCPLDGLEVVL